MATYLILNLCFLIGVVFLLRIKPRHPSRVWWLVLGLLLILTSVFDSLIITAEIVGYDTQKILGIYIGKAPIEDFFYAIVAVILVPSLWNKFGGAYERSN